MLLIDGITRVNSLKTNPVDMIWIVANNVELRTTANNEAQFVEFTYLIQ